MDSTIYDVGPQPTGEFIPADTGLPQPVDVGGTAPATYSNTTLDIFRLGIGAWSQNQQNKQLLQYAQYQTTGNGLNQSGQVAGTTGQTVRAVSGNILSNPIVLLLIVGGVYLATRKG